MSTILDAIRKAETQRNDDVVPSLEAIVMENRSGSRRNRRRASIGWLIWLALIVVVASSGYLYQEQLLNGWDIARAKASKLASEIGAGKLVKKSHTMLELIPKNAQPNLPASGVATTSAKLSAQQRDLLDSMRFDVVSYSVNDNRRFFILGGRTYREGDKLDGFTVEKIGIDGVTLDVGGDSVLIRP